jgi:hypothetical protein
MRTSLHALVVAAGLVATACGETIFPTETGTVWKYQMTQEFGAGVRANDPSIKPDADGKVRLPVTITVAGSEKIDNVKVHKFEMRRQGVVRTIQFLQVDDQGVFEVARGDESGERTKFDPPQKILSLPLKVGEKWEYHGEGAGEKVDEIYEIVAQESIEVPAGKFDAYHLHIVGTQPFNSVVDRWFVPNVGEVKDVTEVRRPNGSMIQRISLALAEGPKIGNSSEAKPSETAKKLSITLGKAATGEATTHFAVDTPKVYARWQGHELPEQAKVRAVWIAENVGEVAPPNYKVDEASVVATSSNSSGTFTLSRPDNGWPLGSYRVEVYVDDALTETAKLTIAK